MTFRNENISYPGSAWRPGQTIDLQSDYLRIKTDPNATEVLWWRAEPDLNWNPTRLSGSIAPTGGAGSSNGSEFIRVQQTAGPYWAIIEGERILMRYFQPGSFESGSIAVLYNPNDFQLSQFDWIMQKGQGFGYPNQIVNGYGTVAVTGSAVVGIGTFFTKLFVPGAVFSAAGFSSFVASITDDTHLILTTPAPSPIAPETSYTLGGPFPGAIDARTFRQKEVIVRGSTSEVGVGSVSVAGTSATGTGTTFVGFFRPGDVFLGPNGFAARVVAVADNTHVTLDVAPGVNLVDVPFSKGVDYLTWPIAASVAELRDANQTYVQGINFQIDPTGEFIQWLSPETSPAPGTRYSIIYDYYTRYVVTELGLKGTVVKGYPGLTLVAASLWKPQQNRR